MVGSSGLEKARGEAGLPSPPLGTFRFHRCDGDVGAALGFGTVRHASIDQRKQRVIPTQANVFARMPFGPMLSHDDVAGTTWLAAEQLDAEALARGIAAVARGSACFLVRHGGLPSRI